MNKQEVYTDLEQAAKDEAGNILFRQATKAASLRKTLQEQLDFAEKRLIEATNQEVYDEKLKWSGYCQALRFIQSEL